VIAARAVLAPRTVVTRGRCPALRPTLPAGPVVAAVAGTTLPAGPGSIAARLPLLPRAVLTPAPAFRTALGSSTAAVRTALVATAATARVIGTLRTIRPGGSPVSAPGLVPRPAGTAAVSGPALSFLARRTAAPWGLVIRQTAAVPGAAPRARCRCVVVAPLPVPALVAVAAVALAAAVLSHPGPSVSSFVSLYAVISRDPKRPPAPDPKVREPSVTAFTSPLRRRSRGTVDAGHALTRSLAVAKEGQQASCGQHSRAGPAGRIVPPCFGAQCDVQVA